MIPQNPKSYNTIVHKFSQLLLTLILIMAIACKDDVHAKPTTIHKKDSTGHNLDQTIHKLSRVYDINPKLLTTIMYMESRGEQKPMKARRFEGNRLLERAYRHTKDPHEAKMLASSHCATQILGLTAKDFGVHWSELYEPEMCIEMAVFLVARHKHNCKKYNAQEVLEYCIARRYNGSKRYAKRFLAHFYDLERTE